MLKWIIAPGCFSVLGCLAALHLKGKGLPVWEVAAYGALFAMVSMSALALLLVVVNGKAGFRQVWSAVANGFMLLLPFTLLATFAEYLLHWSAVQAFASAGIMTACAMTGTEVGKIGKRPLPAIITASGGGLVIGVLWMVAGTWLIH